MDLSTCDHEPIHLPGAIQPHGQLLALNEPSLNIVQASANLSETIGRPAEEFIGQPLAAALGAEAATRVAEALLRELEDVNPLRLTIAGVRHDGLLHRHQGVAILELERSVEEEASARTHHPLRSAILHLQSADTLDALCETVAREVRLLTGFERVMLYQFDAEGHGHVRAEAKREDLEPFLGLRYPASDIPRQARQLYLSNWLRIIPDARYVPVRLVPELRVDTRLPLDLSFSVLRSVSPVHLEYLANMGVRASMSVSLVVGGRLWGLISCAHHSGPRFLPFGIRSDCELLGRLTSQRLSALEDREVAERRAARRGTLQALAAATRDGERVLPALLACPAELLGLVDASGVAVLDHDETLTSGAVPTAAAIRAIADWLGHREAAGVFSTSALAADLPALGGAKDVASGVLSFALPGSPERRILWFRPEILRTVNWGGDPRKPALDTGETRLHPRRSFALWREEVRLRSRPWRPADLEAAEDLRRLTVEADLEKQIERERIAVRARDDLVAVVSHDLKNPLHVIQMQLSVIRDAARAEADDRGVRLRAGIDRIQRSAEHMNALIHDLLDLARIEAGRFELRRAPERVDDVIEEAMAILRPLAEAKHVSLLLEHCPDLTLQLDRERIFQVLSNLIGNAVKFTPGGGRITLSVLHEDSEATFAVADTGPGIPAEHLAKLFNRYWQAHTRRASGSGLGLYIAKGIIEAHGGKIWVELPRAGGAIFKFTLPGAPGAT